MKTDEIAAILDWVKTTDLVGVGLKNGGRSFSFSTEEGCAEGAASLPPPRYQCVSAPAVGFFQWSSPGRVGKAEGSAVAAGEAIGLIETLPGKTTPVTASVSGKIARALIEAPAPVAYGQPILFIEPDAA